MREVTDATFEAEVLASERTVVVDFWAPWCGPCKTIEPILEELAGTRADVDLVRIDVEASPQTAERYTVLSLPTVIIFAGGEPREHVHGARGRKHYVRALERVLAG
jgi:thioredoxin 1